MQWGRRRKRETEVGESDFARPRMREITENEWYWWRCHFVVHEGILCKLFVGVIRFITYPEHRCNNDNNLNGYRETNRFLMKK